MFKFIKVAAVARREVLETTPEFLTLQADDSARPYLGEGQIPFHGAETDRDPDLVTVDEIDLHYGLGATYVDGYIEAEKRIFSRTWLRLFTRAAPESLVWTVGDGDSMEPTIRSGEVVLIDRSQNTIRMTEGIWAVALGDFGMIKRVHSPDGERIELRSDNQLIPPIAVAQDELHVIGRVVAVVRRL